MRLAAFAVGALLVCAAATARAGEPERAEAKELFRAGLAAYERHDYSAAALAFEEAHRRAPNASTIINAARAWDDGGELGKAADDYALAIADPALDDASRSFATSRIADLEKKLATLAVDAPSGALVSIGRLRSIPAPLVVHLAPGAYDIEVTLASGGPVLRRPFAARAGMRETVTIAATPASVAPPPPPPPTLPAVGVASHPGRPLVIAGGVTLGVGAVLAISAVALGLATVGARDDYDRSNDTDGPARSHAITLRTVTNVAWASTAAAAVAGATLLTIGIAKNNAVAVSGRSFVFSGSF